jgi:carbonic anhydrase
MDARIHAPAAFGIDLGDAHIIRNAGGSARDALRSLVISQQLLGTTEILLIKHTGCGMLTFSNADATSVVEKNLGKEAVGALKGFGGDFRPFGDLERAVEEDVKELKSSDLISKEVTVSGWVYEVETGKVKRVV